MRTYVHTNVDTKTDTITLPYGWPEWCTQHIDNEGTALARDNGQGTRHHAHTADNVSMVEVVVTAA